MYKEKFRHNNVTVQLKMNSDTIWYKFRYRGDSYGNSLGIGDANCWEPKHLELMRTNAKETIDELQKV